MIEGLLYFRSRVGQRGRLLFRSREILSKEARFDGCFIYTVGGGHYQVVSTVPEFACTITITLSAESSNA